MKMCSNCKNLGIDHNCNGSEGGMMGYTDVYCSKGHFSGNPPDGGLDDEIQCDDWVDRSAPTQPAERLI